MMKFRALFFQNEDDDVAVEVKTFVSGYRYRANAEARDYCKKNGYARFELWDPEF